MARPHHYEFVQSALREAFFANPHKLLAELTGKRDRPLIALWRSVGALMATQGEAVLPSTGLSTTLVNLGHEQACVVVSLPTPAECGESYFAALATTSGTFRYLTLERPSIPAFEEGTACGELRENTPHGDRHDLGISIPARMSEFVYAVRAHLDASRCVSR
jgi:hypothetical protein